MILYPAIDLKDGACVRLVRGEMASATVFSGDPAAQACRFAEAGFSWLHVVDLNGAFAGRSVNGEAVKSIVSSVDLRIQLGGGIRDRAAIDNWLSLGIERHCTHHPGNHTHLNLIERVARQIAAEHHEFCFSVRKSRAAELIDRCRDCNPLIRHQCGKSLELAQTGIAYGVYAVVARQRKRRRTR